MIPTEVEDMLNLADRGKFAAALELLRQAQNTTEEMYMETAEQE